MNSSAFPSCPSCPFCGGQQHLVHQVPALESNLAMRGYSSLYCRSCDTELVPIDLMQRNLVVGYNTMLVRSIEELRTIRITETIDISHLSPPKPASRWQHKNGSFYTVLVTANHNSTKQDEYPVTVVYMGDDGNVWSLPLCRWHTSMTEVLIKEIADVQQG